jgi:hypothetical protein
VLCARAAGAASIAAAATPKDVVTNLETATERVVIPIVPYLMFLPQLFLPQLPGAHADNTVA